MNDPIRVGVLGIARGSWFARALAHTRYARLAALCARHRDRLERMASNLGGGASCFTSYEDMLDSDLDAVVVASGPADHVEHACQALARGKHVLSEVPAATDARGGRRLLEAVRASGRTYMLAENFCYMRAWSLVKRLVADGLLGEPVFGEGRLLARINFQPPGPDARWSTAEWAMRRGHPYATHYWGPLYQALGEPLHMVVCLGSGQHHAPWARADDTCVVLGNTARGKLVQVRLDFFNPVPSEGYISLQGTKGCCRVSASEQAIHVDGLTPRNEWQSLWNFQDRLGPEWQAVPESLLARGFDSGLSLLIDDFARAVLEGGRPPIDVVDALNMSAPGWASEVSRDRGGAPASVEQYDGAGLPGRG